MSAILRPAHRGGFAGAALVLALLSAPAGAGPIDLPAPTCTTENCQSLQLLGRVNGHTAGASVIPNVWIGQFAGKAGHCLRLDVTEGQRNLAMTVVEADADLFTSVNKNSGTCPTCPRVIVAASRPSVYTAIVANQSGLGSDFRFTLQAVTYPIGNPNCSPATPRR
jgi:hypothetical protein